MLGGMEMKQSFLVWMVLITVVVSACGRDDQGAPAPAPGPAPTAPAPVLEAAPPAEGGAVGGYCGIFCRMRLRRMQRRQGCW